MKRLLSSIAVLALSQLLAPACLVPLLPDQVYTQDFDQPSERRPDHHWRNPTLPDGWHATGPGQSAIRRAPADDGDRRTGGIYSYGDDRSGERALGSLGRRNGRSGDFLLGLGFVNAASESISALSISYVGEVWRLGAWGRADGLDFQYSTDATSLRSGNWIDMDALDFLTPDSRNVGARDGNDPRNQRLLSGSLDVDVPAGQQFWLRWRDRALSGPEDGLAIDDFRLSAVFGGGFVPIPEPSTLVSGLGLTGLVLLALRRRH